MRNQRMAFLLALMSVALVSRTVAGADENETLLELRKEKLAAAKEWWVGVIVAYSTPDIYPHKLYDASIALKTAEYDLASNKRERLAALNEHASRMEELHRKIHALFIALAKGGEGENEAATKFWVSEAKIWVLEEKAKP